MSDIDGVQIPPLPNLSDKMAVFLDKLTLLVLKLLLLVYSARAAGPNSPDLRDSYSHFVKAGDEMVARVGLNHQVIVRTAAEIADLHGLENVTLAAVAECLGVRKPSLYNHINGLPELRRELAVWGTDRLTARISEAAIGKAKQDAVLAIAAAYRSFARERPGLYLAIISSPDRNCLALKAAIERMMAVIKTVLRPYNLDEKRNIHAVRGLRSLMHGFVSMEAAGWFAAPVDREESYTQLIMAFIHGIESPEWNGNVFD